jgi:molybdate transport system substrate-binding protein
MLRLLLIVSTVLFASAASAQQQLTIAAAADLQPAMTEMAARFEQQTGVKVNLSFGSSGNFYAQIQNGAPYDLFFSADVEYPRKLEAAGLTVPGSLYRYAIGKIALWVPKHCAINVSNGLEVLATPAVKKIAIANPAHAPYGRAAEAALRNAGLWEKVASKLVSGENIAQAAQFVESGSADAGIIALSLAMSPAMKGRGDYFIIPQELYPPLQQGAVILKASGNVETARNFLEFLKAPGTISPLKQYGFATPEAQ